LSTTKRISEEVKTLLLQKRRKPVRMTTEDLQKED
jgi:hypothetical protein